MKCLGSIWCARLSVVVRTKVCFGVESSLSREVEIGQKQSVRNDGVDAGSMKPYWKKCRTGCAMRRSFTTIFQ